MVHVFVGSLDPQGSNNLGSSSKKVDPDSQGFCCLQ